MIMIKIIVMIIIIRCSVGWTARIHNLGAQIRHA